MKTNMMNVKIKSGNTLLLLVILIAGLSLANKSYAEKIPPHINVPVSSTLPQQIMAKIYKAYDSINYLSFDIKYTYTSDTVNGDFINDVLAGSYTLAGKKAKFNLGDIEFMQNDSFFISVYNGDKLIVVADPRNTNAGNELPMRQIMDSLITTSDHYTVTNTIAGDTGILVYNQSDSAAQFLQFKITYDSATHLLHSINYVFEEAAVTDSMGYTSLPVARKKILNIEFSKYRFDNLSDSLYDENQYVFFENRICKPVDKYNDFKIYNSRRPDIIR